MSCIFNYIGFNHRDLLQSLDAYIESYFNDTLAIEEEPAQVIRADGSIGEIDPLDDILSLSAMLAE